MKRGARRPTPGFFTIFRRALWATYKDGCFGYAKGAAYSALLSFFPVLTTVTTLLVQANAEAVSARIAQFLFEVVPPGAGELVMRNFTMAGGRPIVLPVFAMALSVWAASGVMMSLMEGFHAAYRVQDKRSFLHKRITSVLLVFAAILPAVGASALILFGERAERSLLVAIGLLPAAPAEQLRGGLLLVGRLARFGISLGTVVLVTALLYRLGPHCPTSLRNVWPGATLATSLWLAATLFFGWYVRNIADYNLLYGSIGAVIALLFWMYVLAVIALIGCAYNAERERQGRHLY
ncbi:MAG: YihY/virulence factor BrkB family protein [Bryobacteraceae bacterium]